MSELKWSSRTIKQDGIILPWQRVEPYGPFTFPDGRVTDKPPKGTVLESGEVFVPMDVLYEVSQRTSTDAMFGVTPPDVGYHEQMALEQAGLARGETRGGCHGTEKLHTFLGTWRKHE